jgi:hypothetical protein
MTDIEARIAVDAKELAERMALSVEPIARGVAAIDAARNRIALECDDAIADQELTQWKIKRRLRRLNRAMFIYERRLNGAVARLSLNIARLLVTLFWLRWGWQVSIAFGIGCLILLLAAAVLSVLGDGTDWF